MGWLLSLLLTKNINVHENPWILSGTLTSPTISKLWPEAVTHVTSVCSSWSLGSLRLMLWKWSSEITDVMDPNQAERKAANYLAGPLPWGLIPSQHPLSYGLAGLFRTASSSPYVLPYRSVTGGKTPTLPMSRPPTVNANNSFSLPRFLCSSIPRPSGFTTLRLRFYYRSRYFRSGLRFPSVCVRDIPIHYR